MCCAIQYHLCNLKNVKNTHGGVSLLVKLQVEAYNVTTESNTAPRFFKLYKLYQIGQRVTCG